MDRTHWHKQTPDKPLYADLLWSRPENKRQAGKLLVIGGNAHGFSAAAEAYAEAEKAGIGTVRVVLPDSLRKTVGQAFEAGEYAPSTPSGSFSRQAMAELLDMADWADGVLLAGDFGRNSETAILLEQFIAKCPCQITLTQDAINYFTKAPGRLLENSDATLVVSFAQLQQIAMNARFTRPFTFDMDLLRLVDALREFTNQFQPAIIIKHLNNIFVAYRGEVSSTKLAEDIDIWRVRTAAHAAVWRLQNPAQPFEALTTALSPTG